MLDLSLRGWKVNMTLGSFTRPNPITSGLIRLFKWSRKQRNKITAVIWWSTPGEIRLRKPGLLNNLLAFSLLQIKQWKAEVKLWWLCRSLSELDYRAALEGGLVWRNVFIRTGDWNASQWAANKSVNAPDDVLLHWKRLLWTKFSSKSSWNGPSLVWGTVKKI